MQPRVEQTGSRKVEPHKRKRKSTPSDRTRAARRLVARIEQASAAGESRELNGERGLYARKRKMRRDIYAERPALEGPPVYRRPQADLRPQTDAARREYQRA